MPRAVARAAGVPNLPRLTRAYGLREIGTGIGILTSKDPSPWLWGRVAGDALDVATVGAGLVTARPAAAHPDVDRDAARHRLLDMKVAEAAPPARKTAKRSLRDYSTLGLPAVGRRDARHRPDSRARPMGRAQGSATPMTGSPRAAAGAAAAEPVGSVAALARP